MDALPSAVNPKAADFLRNQERYDALLAELRAALAEARSSASRAS